MSQRRDGFGRAGAACVALVSVLSLAACSSSSSSGSTSKPASGLAGGADAGASRAAAAIKPFIGHPSAFPVSEPLTKLPRGDKVVYLYPGTPYGALLYSFIQPAAQAMGLSISKVNAGSGAASVNTAFSSVMSQKPAAVLVGGIQRDLWARNLQQFQSAGIKVVTTGVDGLDEAKGVSSQAAEHLDDIIGKLMADYVTTKFGKNSHTVVYTNSELSFTADIAKVYTTELNSVCPGCKTRQVRVPIATVGTTAPQTVVSDLQSHPDTTVAVFANDETETGLPSAMKAAGITKVKTLGAGPVPTNLQYVKDGTETATLAVDTPLQGWMVIDAAARLIEGRTITGSEADGIQDMQFLTQKEITFDPSKGWSGYPDFADRFKKLWGLS